MFVCDFVAHRAFMQFVHVSKIQYRVMLLEYSCMRSCVSVGFVGDGGIMGVLE